MQYPPSDAVAQRAAGATQTQPDDDEIDLRQLFYTLADNKWLIAAVTALSILLGTAYALLSTPVYESNILVQVEDATGGIGKNLISEASALFDVKTDAAAEMEILRSRMIAAKPVDALGLNIDARARYFPLIGKGIARLSEGLSTPGILGLGGYVWGQEFVKIPRFQVPPNRLNERFVLTAMGQNAYRLRDPLTGQSFLGKVGELVKLNLGSGGDYSILVEELVANPGAEFRIYARSRLQEIEKLQKELVVAEKGKKSGVISVALKGDDPLQIATVLNTIAQEYLRQNIDRKSEEAENSLKFLAKQLPELKKELEAAESQYNNYRNARGTVNLGEEAKTLLEQSTASQAKLAELKQRRLELSARYLAEHPNMRAIDSMLRQAQVEADRVNALIRRLPLVEQDAVRLTRDMKVSTDLYASLLQTMQQLRLVKAGKIGTVRLIDEAYVPEKPVAPKRALVLAIATLGGLLLGALLVLLRRAMQDKIESPEQVEQLTSLPVLASVPHSEVQDGITQQLGKQRNAQLLARSNSNDPAVESLRSFLTAMQFASLGARNNVIVITGPTPSVGKSFISANFAALLANSGKRVLLVDGDIRKGYLHKYFAAQQAQGLSEWIAGSITLEQALRRQIVPNIDFVSCGIYPPNPAELLRHPRVAQFLQEQSALYDYVVIDAAPALPVSDPAILASHAGSTVLVVREGQNSTSEVLETKKRLMQAGVAITGIVFNDLQISGTRYRYGYKYAYSYGYGNDTPARKPGLGRRALQRIMGT